MTEQEYAERLFEKWATHECSHYDGKDIITMYNPEFCLALTEALQAQREACRKCYEALVGYTFYNESLASDIENAPIEVKL